MKQKPAENTLLLGNGFSRSIFRDMPSWGDLFEGVDSSIRDYTILYEAYRLNQANKHIREDEVKSILIRKIKDAFSEKNIKEDIRELERFGTFLERLNVNNIITTNYDDGVEFILTRFCGYKKRIPEGLVPEQIYSIRTHYEFYNDNTGHCIKLWKIHGDMERIKSITLGFDQYCGSLSKLMDYIKGSYKSSKNSENTECKIPMIEKCSSQKFDGLSWAELFFRTNLYIIGFGMNFSEIDIWWLLNKRARFQLEIPLINNSITYLYNEEYEKPDEKKAIFSSLHAFNVECKPIRSDADYISSIFKSMS